MAQDPFDFSDVFADLEKKIDDFMRDDTTKEIAAKMFAESTQELVYDKYEPKGHPKYTDPGYPISRRYDQDGLKDWRNYHVLNIGKMNMTIINETKGNSYWNPEWNPVAWDSWDPGYINDIIEEGVGYNWKKSEIYRKQPYPRPFMDKACDRFVDDFLLPSIRSTFFDD